MAHGGEAQGTAILDPDDLPDGVVVADGQGRITAVNGAAERVLGRQKAELLGADIRTAVPLEDPDGNRWWACTDPWSGLATRTGHRERLLLLPGVRGPREVFVTASTGVPAEGGRSTPSWSACATPLPASAPRRRTASSSRRWLTSCARR
jgi:PAS domain-containing protein